MSSVIGKHASMELRLCTNANHYGVKCAIAGLLLRGPFASLLSAISLLLFGTTITLFNSALMAIGVVLFAIGAIEMLFSEYKFIIFSFLAFLLLWFVNMQMFPNNLDNLKNNWQQFFIFVLPFLWIGRYIGKHNDLIPFMLLIAKIKLLIILLCFYIGLLFPTSRVFNDYMDLANEMLIGSLAVVYLSFKGRRINNIVVSIISAFTLLFYGSRGVFLCVCLFVVFLILLGSYKKTTKIAFVAAIVLFVALYNPFIILLSGFGINSHIVSSTANSGSMFIDELRMNLFRGFWECIIERPLGYGVLGDRQLPLTRGFSDRSSVYPHNIILELMVDFGYIGGGIILLVFICLCYKGIIKNKNISQKELLILLFCGSFVKLMVSSSFWLDQYFFMLLGVLCSVHSLKGRYCYGKKEDRYSYIS